MGRSALIALVLLPACSQDLPPARQQPDGGPTCLAGSHTCLPGFRCVGNLCTATCTGGTACPAGNYCGGPTAPNDVCAPITAKGCASFLDCPFPQNCQLGGRCTVVEVAADGGVQACAPGAVPDECAPDAVCTLQGLPTCIGLSPCGQDGGCAGTSISHACNMLPDGGQIIPGKGRICLLEQCGVPADCIAGALCVHLNPAVTFGKCQFGVFTDPCLAKADCAPALSCLGAGVLADGGPQTGSCSCADGGINADGGCD